MKFLVLLFLVGFASAASIYDASHDIDETVKDLSVASSFLDLVTLEDVQFADEGGDDFKENVEKKLREHFEKVLQKVLDAFDKGQAVKEDVIEKLKELREKLKDMKINVNDKVKELMKKVKDKAKDYLEKLLDKLGLKENKEKRAVVEGLKELLRKFKKALLDTVDKDKLKEKIENIFGKGSEFAEYFIAKLKEKGEKAKQHLLDFIDRILGEKEHREERSVSEMWQKLKEVFQKWGIVLDEKLFKFGEFVKEKFGTIIEGVKTKLEKIKAIAEETKNHAKEMSKDIAAEALEFLRPYKEDLGALWEQTKDALKEVLNRKE